MPAATSNRHAIEAGLEVVLAAQADNLFGYLALIEKEQGGDGANAVFGSDALLVVNVDLADADFAVVFVGEFIEDRRDHFAWAAPFSPKVHKDGRFRLEHFLGEIRLRKVNNVWRGHNGSISVKING